MWNSGSGLKPRSAGLSSLCRATPAATYSSWRSDSSTALGAPVEPEVSSSTEPPVPAGTGGRPGPPGAGRPGPGTPGGGAAEPPRPGGVDRGGEPEGPDPGRAGRSGGTPVAATRSARSPIMTAGRTVATVRASSAAGAFGLTGTAQRPAAITPR